MFKTKFEFNVQPTINRGIVLTVFPIGKPLQFIVLHHKKTTALQFQVDSKNPIVRNREIMIKMYRNLDNCNFCKTFFELDTVKNDNLDYRGKFNGINSITQKYLINFMKEKYDFQIPTIYGNEPTMSSKNNMLVMGWKVHGIEDDLVFVFVQRRCYNNVTRVNLIRTAAIQFVTERGMELLTKFEETVNNTVRKTNSDEFLKIFNIDNSTEENNDNNDEWMFDDECENENESTGYTQDVATDLEDENG